MTKDSSSYQDFIKKRPFPAYEGDEPFIFVSYAHVDAERVFPELVKFKENGFNIWYDQGIAPGMGWRRGIMENLSKSSLCVVFLSENSAKSEGVLKEIVIANEEGIPIIPIYLEFIELKGDIRYELMLIQAIFKCDMTENEYVNQWKKAFKNHIGDYGVSIGDKKSDSDEKDEEKTTDDEIEPLDSTFIQNFKYLDDLIHNGKTTIKLDSDIKLDDSEKSSYANGIMIDVDNIVIDGNKHFIDANSLSSIFNVSGKNVIIKNVNFKNGYAYNSCVDKHQMGGGAIHVIEYASLTLVDSQFFNNYSESDGGAIFNRGILDIKNCIFEKNSAESSGGAIANFHLLKMFKTTFKKNESFNGGAIYCYHQGSMNLRDCKLRNNSSSMFAGGIYNYGELIVEGGTFSKNSAESGAGAILNYGHAEIQSVSFSRNSALLGGAIFNMAGSLVQYLNDFSSITNEKGSIKFNDCSFASNKSDNLGGVICNLSKCKFVKCTFGKNFANGFSHIINNGPKGVLQNISDDVVDINHYISILTISDCIFRIKGDVEKDAIYNQRNCLLKISSNTQINGKYPTNENIIFYNEGEIEII